MKRIVSIFLLLLMLVVGAHPVLAMHFCEGNLHSVGILDNDIEKSCCDDMANMPQYNEPQSCCAENSDATSHHKESGLSKSHEDCCDIQKIKISTDDYQRQERQLNTNHILLSFDNVWFTLNYIINSIEPDNTVEVRQTFPPGGLINQHVDLLTYICIYRI